MVAILGILSLIGFFICFVSLIIKAFKKKPKKKSVIALLACFVCFVVCVSQPSATDKPKSDASMNAETASSSAKPEENSKEEEAATKLLTDAQKAFDDGNYSKMLEKCNAVLNNYANTASASSVPKFIDGLIESAPHATSEEICAEYEKNEVNADNIYRDKLVVVSGSVKSIGKDILDAVYITLEDGEQYSFGSSQFMFKDENEIGKIAGLETGDNVTVIGGCSGLSVTSVLFKDCFLLE